MIDALRDAVLACTEELSGTDGVYRTAVPDLAVIRGDQATSLQHAVYDPALIVVIQGSKDLLLGGARFTYRAGQFLIMSVGLPVLAGITDASNDRPYLALALRIDFNIVNELLDVLGREPDPTPAPARHGLYVGTLDAPQAGAIARLAMLLPNPKALGVLYPSIAREIFYWILTGRDGAEIRRLAMRDSHTQRIAEAIAVMRAEFTESIPVERLAAVARMSPSSFHRHFKVLTSMSPLQHQKHLRLLAARGLMLAGGADATRAAHHVGYASTSQFSREYTRMFGAPPRRDVMGWLSAR